MTGKIISDKFDVLPKFKKLKEKLYDLILQNFDIVCKILKIIIHRKKNSNIMRQNRLINVQKSPFFISSNIYLTVNSFHFFSII